VTEESDTFDFMSAARRVAAAALANEDSVKIAAGAMREVVTGLQQLESDLAAQQKNLPLLVVSEVDRKLSETVTSATKQISQRFAAAHEAAAKAQKTFEEAADNTNRVYQRAAASLTKGIVRNSLICFAVGCLGMIFGVWLCVRLFLPPADILQRERNAEQAVSTLAPEGGNSLLNWCNTSAGRRRCVRTDERTEQGAWGDPSHSETYRIIYGY
jgi:hypothetical protein